MAQKWAIVPTSFQLLFKRVCDVKLVISPSTGIRCKHTLFSTSTTRIPSSLCWQRQRPFCSINCFGHSVYGRLLLLNWVLAAFKLSRRTTSFYLCSGSWKISVGCYNLFPVWWTVVVGFAGFSVHGVHFVYQRNVQFQFRTPPKIRCARVLWSRDIFLILVIYVRSDLCLSQRFITAYTPASRNDTIVLWIFISWV